MNQELQSQLLGAASLLTFERNTNERIHELKTKIREERGKLLSKEQEVQKAKSDIECKGRKIAARVLLIVGFVMLGIVLLVFLEASAQATDEELPPILIEYIICAGVYVAPAFIISFVLKSGLLKRRRQNKERYEKLAAETERYRVETTEPEVEECNRQIEELSQRVAIVLPHRAAVLSFLPRAYHDLLAVSYMLETVTNGRAETLKEALNAYEEQLRHWELMEEVRQQNMHAQYLEQTLDTLYANQARINENLGSISSDLRDLNYKIKA